MSAMWLSGLGAVKMSEVQFRNETLYQLTMSLAKNLLRRGVISRNEYRVIDTIFLKKYSPSLGGLFADIDLINVQ